jgi:hypothetical protein
MTRRLCRETFLGVLQGPGSDCKTTNCQNPSDLDNNGRVDIRDFGRFQACFGSLDPLACNPIATPDLNGDGQVDIDDYALFIANLTGPGS